MFFLMRILLCLFLVSFLLNLNGCRIKKPHADLQTLLTQQGYVAVPLYQTQDKNYFLVRANLNGDKPVYFLLDTGSTVTSLNKAALERLGLKFRPTSIATISGESGSTITGYNIVLPQIAFINFTSYEEPAEAAPNYLQSLNIENNPIGTLGLNFLRRYRAIVDYPHQQIYIWPRKNPPLTDNAIVAAEHLIVQLGYETIPLISAPTTHFLVKVRVDNSRPLNFLLDSGSSQSILSLKYAEQHHLTRVPRKLPGQGSTGGIIRLYNIPNVVLAIGNIIRQLSNIVGVDFRYVLVGLPVYGAVGNDLLQSNEAIIDTPAKKLYLLNKNPMP